MKPHFSCGRGSHDRLALGGIVADYVSLTYLFAALGVATMLVGLSLFRQPAVAELA